MAPKHLVVSTCVRCAQRVGWIPEIWRELPTKSAASSPPTWGATLRRRASSIGAGLSSWASRRRGKEILAGLDKDGKPLKPISKETREHRKSAMSPSGKGDPNAPPLIPASQKSRTYSLLAGRALTTHAEFFWRYDTWTGESWGDILAYQRTQGRDVIGISVAAVAKVKAQSWAKWESWKQGTLLAGRSGQGQAARDRRAPGRPLRGRPCRARHDSLWRIGPGRQRSSLGVLRADARPEQSPGRRDRLVTPAGRRIRRPGRRSRDRSTTASAAATWNQGSRRGSSGTAAPVPPPPRPRNPCYRSSRSCCPWPARAKQQRSRSLRRCRC